jgi:hypothetical protein
LTALDTSARRGRPGGTANRICTEYPQEEESGRLLGARRPLRKDAPRAQGSAEGSIDRGGPRQSASTERAMAMMGEEGKRCSGRAGRNEARRNSLWIWSSQARGTVPRLRFHLPTRPDTIKPAYGERLGITGSIARPKQAGPPGSVMAEQLTPASGRLGSPPCDGAAASALCHRSFVPRGTALSTLNADRPSGSVI